MVMKSLSSSIAAVFRATAVSALALGASAASAQDTVGVQLGALTCKGTGGWGAIITSKKTFDCTYSSYDGAIRSKYNGVITKYGLDLGVTGETALGWLVLAPGSMAGSEFVPGSLAGDYIGVGAEATLGVGAGANVLVGGSEKAFTLQPVSVQVQTGISVSAAVQTLKLTYVGPVQ